MSSQSSEEERHPFNYLTAQTLKLRAPWKTPKTYNESLMKTVNNEQVHRHEFSKSMYFLHPKNPNFNILTILKEEYSSKHSRLNHIKLAFLPVETGQKITMSHVSITAHGFQRLPQQEEANFFLTGQIVDIFGSEGQEAK